MKTIKTPWSDLWNPNIWVAMEKKKVFFKTFNGNTVVNGINHQCDIQK
jgi:hypothetical protein